MQGGDAAIDGKNPRNRRQFNRFHDNRNRRIGPGLQIERGSPRESKTKRHTPRPDAPPHPARRGRGWCLRTQGRQAGRV
ncbi:hypothetical protein GCM10011363_26950 [Marivita lacus]|uniref:Uncharacterized protein n=1 Tax=Marivita lacus TaxID=1323742 RepID=A0ABQ1KVR1_9RHOB|nr:hypothetical protein GCM10011363_26950 [Marivita lacus]